MKRTWIKYTLLALAGVFVVIQLIPYGRDHTNPPVIAEPAWDSLQTRELTVSACYDCHSNESVWPWYSNIAPISWVLQYHVDEGRHALNFSEWNRPQEETEETARSVTRGRMPPREYLLVHSAARLTDAQLEALAAGLAATISEDPPGSHN